VTRNTTTTQTTAFVLSGGASLGAIQAGMLEALYERRISPDLIVGASVGSVNGAFIASRPQASATAGELGEIWRGLSRREIFPLNPLTGLLGFFGAGDHLVPDGSLRRLLQEHIGFDRLEQSSIPLHVIATEAVSGRERRLSSGEAIDAVMASVALPGVFPPVSWEGRELIDGGVTNNAPISHAFELGAERVYVLPTGNACDLSEPPKSALGMLLHSMSLLVMRRLVMEIELFRDRELVVLPPPCPLRVSPRDFNHADELIRLGYSGAAKHLSAVDRRETEPAPRITMHDHRKSTKTRVRKVSPATQSQSGPAYIPRPDA
jgi:NTE family protein